MQLMMRGTTAVTCAAGGAITTGNVQVLPQWAPPIQYIGTTAPWEVIVNNCTVLTSAGVALTGGASNRLAKVRAYGRKSNLYSGRECIALSRRLIGGSALKKMTIVVSYRAVGEIVRP